MPTERQDNGMAISVAMHGWRLSFDEARKRERHLKSHPDDLHTRTELLGFYFGKQFKSKRFRVVRQKHALWVIRNRPEAGVAGLPETYLCRILDRDAYSRGKKLWLTHARKQQNTEIYGNAASFLLLHDRQLAEKLLRKAQVLDPSNAEWSERLAHLYSLGLINSAPRARRGNAERALIELENALKLSKRRSHRFYLLDDLAKSAFEAGNTAKARGYARRLLSQAAKYRKDWNYGNAIHYGNLVLGRLALDAGDLAKAKSYLIKAGKTPGSPQLNSFGPKMSLAKELLDKGEREVVLKYFRLCARFWKSGKNELTTWIATVQEGRVPEFRSRR
jgi:hypothetical protein